MAEPEPQSKRMQALIALLEAPIKTRLEPSKMLGPVAALRTQELATVAPGMNCLTVKYDTKGHIVSVERTHDPAPAVCGECLRRPEVNQNDRRKSLICPSAVTE